MNAHCPFSNIIIIVLTNDKLLIISVCLSVIYGGFYGSGFDNP